jgi:queuosine precursor transporter
VQLLVYSTTILKRFGIQKLDLLVSFYIFCIVVTELMGAKSFPLAHVGGFHLNASIAIFFFPFVYLINDIIIEVFGKDKAKSIVRSSWIMVALLFVFTMFATALPPSTRFMPKEAAFDVIFSQSARISAASLTAILIADLLDIYVFSYLRKKLGKKSLWLRSNASNIIAQFVDTTTFMVLAFYAVDKSLGDNAAFLVSIILPYWGVKCAMSIIETPLVYLGVRWLKSDPV